MHHQLLLWTCGTDWGLQAAAAAAAAATEAVSGRGTHTIVMPRRRDQSDCPVWTCCATCGQRPTCSMSAPLHGARKTVGPTDEHQRQVKCAILPNSQRRSNVLTAIAIARVCQLSNHFWPPSWIEYE